MVRAIFIYLIVILVITGLALPFSSAGTSGVGRCSRSSSSLVRVRDLTMSEEEEDAWLPLATQLRKKKLPVIGRRSPIELRGDLLRGIDYLDNGVAEGASPTPLMYATNLSWELVSKHIGVLVEHGLVFKRAITDARYVYKLTEEGQKTLLLL